MYLDTILSFLSTGPLSGASGSRLVLLGNCLICEIFLLFYSELKGEGWLMRLSNVLYLQRGQKLAPHELEV